MKWEHIRSNSDYHVCSEIKCEKNWARVSVLFHDDIAIYSVLITKRFHTLSKFIRASWNVASEAERKDVVKKRRERGRRSEGPPLIPNIWTWLTWMGKVIWREKPFRSIFSFPLSRCIDLLLDSDFSERDTWSARFLWISNQTPSLTLTPNLSTFTSFPFDFRCFDSKWFRKPTSWTLSFCRRDVLLILSSYS